MSKELIYNTTILLINNLLIIIKKHENNNLKINNHKPFTGGSINIL